MYRKIIKKIGDNHLYDAVKTTFAASIPFLFFHTEDTFSIAFTFAMGALLTAPVDIPSSLKHKIVGLTSGSFMIAAITLLLGSTYHIPWLFYPIFIFILFFISMIAVYGHRANLLSFTGLLCISLAFIHDYQGQELLINCLYLLGGGIIYTLVSLIFYFIKPSRYITLEVANCIEKTAEYLDLRAQLWSEGVDKNKIIQDQLTLQIKLNELHESIREYLIRNKANTSNSSSNRKLLVSHSLLLEIMELSSSNAFDHALIRDMFKDRMEIISAYQRLAENFALTLHSLSYHIKANKKYHSPVSLTTEIKAIKTALDSFQKEKNWLNTQEEMVVFSNVMQYANKQLEKIKGLERVFKGRVNADQLRGKYKDLEKFLTPQHYRFSTLIENLTFDSMIFRHSLRLTITIVLGFILGQILPLQKEYWILMTVVVIMRPGYGLTKQRSKERVIGTILGGLIAFSFLFFIHNTALLVCLTILTMILGYWLSYSDYKIGVTFVTIYVVFIYGMLTPNYADLLKYRIIDTAIGAFLAFATTHLLWPSWEFLKIKTHLKKSLEANKEYVKEIQQYYNTKGELTTTYKIARKYAYIEVGNLMASFQRMIQEPKSKQRNKAELYELTVLNQTLISAAAGIGTYIQWHPTTEASEAFNIVMNNIIENLDHSLAIYENKKTDSENTDSDVDDTENTEVEISFTKLKQMRRNEIENELLPFDEKIQKLEESQLIIDQLIWMVNLSKQILKISKKLKAKKIK